MAKIVFEIMYRLQFGYISYFEIVVSLGTKRITISSHSSSSQLEQPTHACMVECWGSCGDTSQILV